MIINEKFISDKIDELYNPWKVYKISKDNSEDYILKADQEFINKDTKLHDKIIWKEKFRIKESRGKIITYSFINQMPVPINGNFYKAKYLLLYSNPGSEETEIDPDEKENLLKCFKLDKKAKLVIPNKHWEDWYIGELDKFFNHLNPKDMPFKINDFLEDFCFINLCAYPTIENEFNYTGKVLDHLMELKSTVFIKELVRIGIEAEKEVFIMRRSEGVWKGLNTEIKNNYLFEKLSNYAENLVYRKK